MTREQNLKVIDNSMGNANVFTFVKQDMIDLVNKMHDDFSSQTCENCKEQSKDEGCPIYYEAYNLHFAEDPKDFGCSKFERKEDVWTR